MDIENRNEIEYLNLFYSKQIFRNFTWSFQYDAYYIHRKASEADSVQFIISLNSNFFPNSLAAKASLSTARGLYNFSNILILTKNYNNESNRSNGYRS